MEIPSIIIKQAHELIEQYGMRIAYIGELENRKVFKFIFPDNQETGFPIVYLYDSISDSVDIVSGPQAFRVLSRFYD